MPSGSDGSIVLSVNIDEEDLGNQISKLKNQLKKSFSSIDGVADRFSNVAQELTKFSQILERINSETHEQIIASEEIKQLKAKTSQEQSKSLQEEEKATQEITNSKIAQEELEQAKTNTVKKTNELLISEQRVEQAVNNTAISHEKLGQSVNKTAISNEQVTQAINRSIISNETMASIDGALAESKEKQVRLEERRSEVISGVSDKYSDIVDEINEAYENSDELTKSAEELKQAINETAISYEKVEQSVIDTAMYQERLRQAINNTAVSEENVEIAKSKVRQEQQKEIINEEKIRQAKEKSRQEQEKTTREILKTKKAQDSVNDATKKVTASLKKMASALGSALGLVVSVTAILNFLSESSKLASQTEAHLQRLGSLYDENAQGVYDWANANAHALGMSTAEAYKAAADFGNLFTTFADSQQSAELSIDMMKATAVVASQTGRTYEETFEKMQSGIYGNTRAIDDLGISVRQSSLMQTQAWKDVSKNGTKSWNDLTDAELQQLRTLGIIEQAQLKYGNTVVQSSELVRSKFNAAWKDFEATWGQVVNVVLIPILQALTQILGVVNTLMTSVLGVFGITLEVKNAQSGIVSQQTQQIDNQKDLNKELGKTNKKMSDQLQSFDKINKLSEDTSDNSSNTSGSGGTSGVSIPETVKSEADFSEIEGLSVNLERIKGILESIAVLTATIGGSLVAWKIADTVIQNSSALLSVFKQISGIALLIAGSVLLIKGYCEAWADGIDWDNFSLVMTGLFGIISGIALVLSPMAAAWVSVGGGIALVVLGIKDIISNGASLKNILTVVAGVATSILGVLGAMGKISVVSTLIPLLASLAGIVIALRGYFDSFINGLNWGNFTTILGGLAVAVVGVKIAIGGLATNIALGLAGVLALIAGMNDFVKNGPTVQNTIMIIGGAISVAVALATGGISALTSAIVGIAAAVGAFVVALASEKNAIMSVEEAQEKLTDAKEKSQKAEETYINSVDNAKNSLKALQKAEKKAGTTGKSLYKQVKSGKLEYSKMTDVQKELYKAYLDNEKQQSDLKKVTKELEEAKKAETLASFENQLALAKENNSYNEYKKAVVKAYKEGTLSANEARDLIGKSMSEMSDDAQQTFMEDIPNDIKNGLDPTQYETKRKQIADFASKTFESFKTAVSNVWESIGVYFNENIKPWFTKEKWTELISKILNSFSSSAFYKTVSDIWSSVKKYWEDNISVWFTSEKWQALVNNIISKFSADKFKNKVKDIKEAVKKYWDENIKPWFTKNKWSTLVSNILDNFKSTTFYQKIKSIWDEIKKFYNDKIKPWFTKEKWQTLTSNIGSGIKAGFKNAINGVIGFFEIMINRVIDGLNKISFTIPKWVPNIGGNRYGINLSKIAIPRLATGAVIPANKEFLAVLGDQKQGTNIEAPAKLIKQMVLEGLSESNYTFGNQEIRVPVYLDTNVLFEAIVKSNEKNTRATGVNVLAL